MYLWVDILTHAKRVGGEKTEKVVRNGWQQNGAIAPTVMDPQIQGLAPSALRLRGKLARPKRLSLEDLRGLPIPLKIEGDMIVLERSSTGRPLRGPVRLPVEHVLRVGERGVVELVFWNLLPTRPRLLPFAFENRSCMKLARYLKRKKSGSLKSFYLYLDCIARYSKWLGFNPDEFIADLADPDRSVREQRLQVHVNALDRFVAELQDNGLSPNRIQSYRKAIKALYSTNGIRGVDLSEPLSRRSVQEDRAPRPEELAKLLDEANLRERLIISMFALGGFREGTLVRLRYGHVREDLERGVVPIHIHVESEITKGKYHSYDTFLGPEAVEYLKFYMEERRRGSPNGEIPPETIEDDAPLIRDERSREVRPIGEKAVYKRIHGLYFKAGLLKQGLGRSYDLKVHSIRSYFKTQLIALGVQPDYVDYMMGHMIDTYDKVKSLGVEFLRNVYASSGLSVRPKTRVSKVDALKEIVRAWGMNPEKILTREAMSEPHRTYEGRADREIQILGQALREIVRKEVLEGR